MQNGPSTAISLLRAHFDFEDGDSYGTPSGNYYWFRKRRQVASLVERNLHELTMHPGSVLADIGCGSGSDLFFLRGMLGKAGIECSYVGVEADPKSLEVCQLRTEHYGNVLDVRFVKGDVASKLPFGPGSVSILYCSEVVEHLTDPDHFFSEAARIIHSGGHLLLTTPNQPNPFQRSFWSARRRRAMQDAADSDRVKTEAAAREQGTVPLHGHISLRTTKEWDDAVAAKGFKLVDFGRGALHYGSTPTADTDPVLAGMFTVQAILDLLPTRTVRRFSDQVIALYRRMPT
jgi:ubiquinone/menaquinone biosynthesis C-methylase UbiE